MIFGVREKLRSVNEQQQQVTDIVEGLAHFHSRKFSYSFSPIHHLSVKMESTSWIANAISMNEVLTINQLNYVLNICLFIFKDVIYADQWETVAYPGIFE